MKTRSFSFNYVEKQIRKKTFAILTTVSPKDRPQSTGILFGVSPPTSKFAIYMFTSRKYAKVRNIKKNPFVSLIIPFPHYWLQFVPASTVRLQGSAELVSADNSEALTVFRQKRILRMILPYQDQPDTMEEYIFIKLKPDEKVFCYGLGMGVMELRKTHTAGGYTVKIPSERIYPI